MVYEALAVQRRQGNPLFVFWEKRCLAGIQDYEAWLSSILFAKVIVLLLSNKVSNSHIFDLYQCITFKGIDTIASIAPRQQQNSLLEYLACSCIQIKFEVTLKKI